MEKISKAPYIHPLSKESKLNGSEEQRPFKCILDVGIRRTCVGHRMWGALKGAVDGGLHVPHKAKNFPGYKAAEEKGGESEYDAEAHKEKIFGNHVPRCEGARVVVLLR